MCARCRAMSETLVKSSSSRWELGLLFLGAIGLIGTTGWYVLNHGHDEGIRELQSWQVSAFHDLGTVDQAIYNSLVTAQDDISELQYYYGPWPAVERLEFFLIPPFGKDLFWETNGELVWTYRDVAQEGEMQGYTLYHGSGGKAEGQGAFILVIGHMHAGNLMANHNTIWIHEDPNQPMPATSRTQSLILDGWKNVVPYTGTDEQRRLQGAGVN